MGQMDSFVMLTYGLIFLVFIATMGIQFWLQRTYAKYSRIPNSRGITGAETARAILDAYGLQNVKVEMVPGALTDHYDPRAKAVRLSEPNYHSPSAAALAVAAHEVGHALQDAKGYAWLRVRANILPVASIGSTLGPWIFLMGMFMSATGMMNIGIWLFAAAALFQLVTLPVEFDASKRALNYLNKMNFLQPSEMGGARAVLSAAAMTYVAALANSLAQILNYVAIMMANRDE